jgi:peptide chain release factor 2
MLLRMYVKFAAKNNWLVDIISEASTPAGLKSVILELPAKSISLRLSENGIHRLTRASPFGNGKLHTSFASVHFSQSVEDKLHPLPSKEIEETFYRGSGPGGQHRNKVESGVRLRHRQSGLLVEICTERSQKSNRDTAWCIMATRWSDQKMAEASDIRQADYAKKSGVAFGYQVRTYKLDKSMVVDDRTGRTVHQPKKVLDGEIGAFLMSA